jgi:murein DD-endopeptidase MepM/ murein hydrolase activator NlpD
MPTSTVNDEADTAPLPIRVVTRIEAETRDPRLLPDRPFFAPDDIPYVDDGLGDPGDLSVRSEKDGGPVEAAADEPFDPASVPPVCQDPTRVTPTMGMVSQGWRPIDNLDHRGIDVAAETGTPIYAAHSGLVLDSGPAEGFGLWVRIQGDDGFVTVYGHNDFNVVAPGQRVEVGQQIAAVGSNGDSTGPHLHFEVWLDGVDIDPWPWLASASTPNACDPLTSAPTVPQEVSSPPPTTQDWDGVAKCESGGDWHINNGNGYFGGLQFDPDTWREFGGEEFADTADEATREQQIIVAERVLKVQGPGAWPSCGAVLDDDDPEPVADATVSTPSTTSERALAAALTQLGVAYTWGGESPETGFDCSGLVWWALTQAGAELPRVTALEMASWGEPVGAVDLRPGDLIISNGGGHIGIYAGEVDGVPSLLHAPEPGDVVKTSPVQWFLDSAIAVRRVL